MAAALPAQITAAQIGSIFAEQYYLAMQQNPSVVCHFYSEGSTMTRFDGPSAVSAVGILQIHSVIMDLSYAGIEIKSAHSIESWSGGILVMVLGLVQSKDYNRRTFAQTFFLAPQETGYFVLNDIFQFIEDEHMHQHPVMLAHSNYNVSMVASNPMHESVSDYTLRKDVQTRSHTAPLPLAQTEAVNEFGIPDISQPPPPVSNSHQNEASAEDPHVSFSTNTILATDQSSCPTEQPSGEPAKHTYASILRTTKGQSGQFINHGASVKVSPPVAELQSAQQVSAQQPQSLSNFPHNNSSTEANGDSAALEGEEGDSRSVYVGNRPISITASELEQEFKNFGNLKPDGVTIRSRKETGFCYGFIEFEDVTGVENALKASPMQFNGQLVHVERRRPGNSSFRGRRGGRGRGGYQPDNLKGNFGGRISGRRSGGQENYDKDFNSRPRGNGTHQRAWRQVRGVLRNHNQQNGHGQAEP